MTLVRGVDGEICIVVVGGVLGVLEVDMFGERRVGYTFLLWVCY